MTVAEQIAKLAFLASDAKAVDAAEAIQRFRAYSRRCDLAAEWSHHLSILEGANLEALPAQVVRESRKQLEVLQAKIKQAIDDACK